MSVNNYLENLASKLVLNSIERDHISKSVDVIRDRLDDYFGTNISEKKLFGSYVRGTILPRKADDNSDVDLMVVFTNEDGYKPQSFLNRLKNFAEHYYSLSEIYQSSPTVVLELNHIKFELTPAYISYGIIFIPNGPSDWMVTDPDSFYDKLTQCNGNNAYKIKPIVRLLKYWNIHSNNRNMPSYKIEERIADNMICAYLTCTSYTEYLIKGLETIKYYTDTAECNSAIDCIKKSLDYESDDMPYSALAEIKKKFPDI